ncbi:MAG TPA: tetratricopeptide repeat protein, partial [Alphaproteobacteria bacterium]|nr:tetratricopeptide repeat protein [Alphaproteobacteria bacterium]
MTGIPRLILAIIVLGGLLAGARAEPPSAGDNGPVKIGAALKQADQLITVEKLAEALAVLKTIEAKTPKEAAKVDTRLGKIFLRLHKPAKAADLFEQAVFSTMDDAEAYLGLAEARLALGDLIKARGHARTALLSDPDLIGAHLVLAKADDRSGRVSAARKRFANLLRNQPESEAVAVAYAVFLSDRDGMEQATKLLSGFVDRHPFAAEASDLLGRLYWRQGRKADALLMRNNAAKAFKAKGNDFRAEAIRSWLVLKGSGFAKRPPPQTGKVEARRTQPRFSPIKRPDPLPFPAGTELSTGSGFVVNGGRYVITNNHVIKDTGKIAVRTGTGEVRLARVIKVTVKD